MIDFAKLVLAADTSQMKTAASDLQGVAVASGRAERAANTLVRAVKALSIGYAATLAIRQFTQATIETERVQAQLAAALESTSGAAQQSIEQLNATAAALQGVTAFGDEAINSMQALLLTFTSIRGVNFDRATRSILDVATAMGTDLNSAALQVGKALNDPIAGLSALSRTGIQFTDAQKETIRALVEMGDVAGAQTEILKELERQFGGSATAARETLGGALKSLGNAWGDLFELSGEASDNLRLSIEELIAVVQSPQFVEGFQSFGASLFNTLTAAAQAFMGLRMAAQDIGYLVGFTDTTWLMDQALRSAAEAADQNTNAAVALMNTMPRGIAVSREMAEAKLAEAEAHLATARAQKLQETQIVAQSGAYLDLVADASRLRREYDSLIDTLQDMVDANDRAGFEQFDISHVATEIRRVQREIDAADAAAAEMLATAADLGPEYVNALIEVNRVRRALQDASGDMVTLKNEVTQGGQKARDLPPPIRDAASAASGLAGQLGVAAMAAANLLAQLRAAPSAIAGLGAEVDAVVAGLERQNSELTYAVNQGWSRQAAQIKAARDEAIELALANGASIDAVAALGAQFDEQALRAEELAAANGTLNDALLAVNETASGGGGGGGGGSTVDAMEDLRKAVEETVRAIVEEAERAKEAYEQGLLAPLQSAMDQTIDAMLDGFKGGMDDIRDIFSRAIKDMIAFAIKNQIQIGVQGGSMGGIGGAFASGATSWLSGGMSGGMSAIAGATAGLSGLAGAIGAIAGPVGIAVGLLGLFRRKKKESNDADKREMDERARLEMRLLELNGKDREIRRLQIAALQEGNRALGRRIQILEEEARIAAEAEGLQLQLLDLQGNTTEIRRRELAALDESNRALQEHIWALEDQAEAAAEAARIQSERMSLEEQRLALLGREDLLRQMQLDSLDASNRALQEQIWALEDAKVVADERATLERQLLQLQGDTNALRAMELEALDATNQALQEEIWALEDAQRIANERLTIEKQILTIQGDTAALRALELEALDESNRALQEYAWALEDAAKAAEEAAAAQKAIDDERLGLEKELLTLQGDVNALRALELAALDESNRALQMQIWALEDYQKALSDITPDSYATLIDYNRALAQAAMGMSPANANGAPSYVNPISPVTPVATSSQDALLAEVKALRQENRDLLIRIDRSTKRESDIIVDWQINGLPEERVA